MTQTAIIDFLLPWAQLFVLAALPVLGGFALRTLQRWHVNKRITDGLARAAGQAYSDLVKSGAVITDAASLHAAVASGVSYMQTRMPDLLKSEGLSPVAVSQMVNAELGKLLAADPSTAVTQTPSPPAPTVVNVTAPAGTVVSSIRTSATVKPEQPVLVAGR